MEGQESRKTMPIELPDTSPDLISSQAPVPLAFPPDSTIISSARPSITFAEWLNWHTSGSYRAATPSGEDPSPSPTTTTPDTPVGADTVSDADDGSQAGASEGIRRSESPPFEGVGVQGAGHTVAPAGNLARGRLCAGQVPDCRCEIRVQKVNLRPDCLMQRACRSSIIKFVQAISLGEIIFKYQKQLNPIEIFSESGSVST